MKSVKNYILIGIIILIFLIIIIVGIIFFNNSLNNKNIINGYYKAEEHFDTFAIQDSVDYCKYYYTDKYDEIFTKEYSKISEENINEIKEYFNKFREWMEACDRLNEYDFDESIIDSNDLYLLYDKFNNNSSSIEYKKFENFTMYFYDINNHVLYYIHANI